MTINLIWEYNRIVLANAEGNWVGYPPLNYNYIPAIIPGLSRHAGANNIHFMDGHVRLVSQADTYAVKFKHTD